VHRGHNPLQEFAVRRGGPVPVVLGGRRGEPSPALLVVGGSPAAAWNSGESAALQTNLTILPKSSEWFCLGSGNIALGNDQIDFRLSISATRC
jgi:hypothetical protein